MTIEQQHRTHDFGPGYRYWGHDYTISKVTDEGARIQVSGWGQDGALIESDDYLLLEAPGKQRATRYRVVTIDRVMDPPDMWHAELVFAPRTYATQEEKDAAR